MDCVAVCLPIPEAPGVRAEAFGGLLLLKAEVQAASEEMVANLSMFVRWVPRKGRVSVLNQRFLFRARLSGRAYHRALRIPILRVVFSLTRMPCDQLLEASNVSRLPFP